jgi:hypothetical protein
MKINDRSKCLCYFALPVLLVAACFIQPTTASAQTTLEVDCSQINVPKLMMEDNMRAGLILIQCGIIKGGQPGTGQSQEPTSPPNIRVSNGSDCNSSESVCGSESMSAGSTADKGQTIVVNYNANYSGGSNYSGTSYSSDGGKTFTEIQPAPFTNGHGQNFGDPLVVFNSKLGEFFAGDLVGSGDCGGQGIGLWTSTDGKTWTTGGCPHNGSFDDRPSMWSDNEPTSATYGRMFVSWNDFTTSCGAGGCLFVTYSDDGTTWSTPTQLNTSTFYRNVQLTGSPRGAKLNGKSASVFIASMDEGGGGNATRQNLMYESNDGGKTWTQVIIGQRFNPPGNVNCGYFQAVAPIWRHMGWGQPAVGPNGVVHYDYAGAGTNGDVGDIFYVQSKDNGKTWSNPIKLNTDTDNQFRTQWMPSLTATSFGRVTASWYDRRKATSACNNVGDASCNYERVGRQSKDNGKTWLADITISSGIITQPSQDDPGIQPCYAGDYDYGQDLNYLDTGSTGTTYVTWTDGRFAIGGVPVQSVDFANVPNAK